MIHIGDCRHVIRTLLPSIVFDLIIADPPFGIGYTGKSPVYNRDSRLVVDGYADIRPRDYRDFTNSWMAVALMRLRVAGQMAVFSSWNRLGDVLSVAEDLGLVQVEHIIWKFQFGVWTTKRMVCSHYHLPIFMRREHQKDRVFNTWVRYSKTERTPVGGSANYRDREDVWQIPRDYIKGEPKSATRLPVELLAKIMQYLSPEGGYVLDPFLGSGTAILAGALTGRRVVGSEQNRDLVNNVALVRLNTARVPYMVSEDYGQA